VIWSLTPDSRTDKFRFGDRFSLYRRGLLESLVTSFVAQFGARDTEPPTNRVQVLKQLMVGLQPVGLSY
jgi:hypothetical protein